MKIFSKFTHSNGYCGPIGTETRLTQHLSVGLCIKSWSSGLERREKSHISHILIQTSQY